MQETRSEDRSQAFMLDVVALLAFGVCCMHIFYSAHYIYRNFYAVLKSVCVCAASFPFK